jgi:hypothetical protein
MPTSAMRQFQAPNFESHFLHLPTSNVVKRYLNFGAIHTSFDIYIEILKEPEANYKKFTDFVEHFKVHRVPKPKACPAFSSKPLGYLPITWDCF